LVSLTENRQAKAAAQAYSGREEDKKEEKQRRY
jgi:hypothetical protein